MSSNINSIKCVLTLCVFALLFSSIAIAQQNNNEVLETIVTYGDSLLAGFIDGTLLEEYQVFSLAAQIATNAKADFGIPLIAAPGFPSLILTLQNGFVAILPDADDGGRVDPDAIIHNFAVPGADVTSALRLKNLGSSVAADEDIFRMILGGKQTMFQSVRKARPSLILFWIGSNDVLGMVLNADISDHTNINKFRRLYRRTVNRMLSLDAKIVAANLPDITTIPFLLDTEEWEILSVFGLKPGEKVPATLLLDFLITGIIPSLNDQNVLSIEELNHIRSVVEDFNEVIDEVLSEAGIPYVDMFSLSQSWDQNPRTYRNTTLSMNWQGGIYSLDGVHPTFTGHALIANEFIDVINANFGTNLKKVNINKVIALDPNISGASKPEDIRLSAARALEGIRSLKRLLELNKKAVSATR